MLFTTHRPESYGIDLFSLMDALIWIVFYQYLADVVRVLFVINFLLLAAFSVSFH